jgi:hypothetical protein
VDKVKGRRLRAEAGAIDVHISISSFHLPPFTLHLSGLLERYKSIKE